MIIQVHVDGEPEPRRYRVRRNDGLLSVQRLDAPGDQDNEPGAPVQVDWISPRPQVYSLLVQGRSYEVHVEQDPEDSQRLAVHLIGGTVWLSAADARRRRMTKLDAGPDGVVRLTAPIPGRVVKVLAPEGTAVKRGDGIIVLEAMKMENELKAPRDGTVTEIAVQEGQGVDGGSVLATIE